MDERNTLATVIPCTLCSYNRPLARLFGTSALQGEEAPDVAHARRFVQPMGDGPVMAALQRRRVGPALDGLREGGVEQCRPDIAPAGRIGDDQVRDPCLR